MEENPFFFLEIGYFNFIKHRGRIFLRHVKGYKGELSRLGGDYIITINKYLSHEEKFKSYIHELLHLGLEYDELQKYGFSKNARVGLEDEIERLVEAVLQKPSALVRHLRFDLERVILSRQHCCYVYRNLDCLD